ncbi:hypothetical protein D3C85_1157260 [compost metagenome]
MTNQNAILLHLWNDEGEVWIATLAPFGLIAALDEEKPFHAVALEEAITSGKIVFFGCGSNAPNS